MSLFNRYTNIFYSTEQETNNELNQDQTEDQNKQREEIETTQEIQNQEIQNQETQTEKETEKETDDGIGLGIESIKTFKSNFISQILEPSLNYIDSTELYVIAVDGVPKFYVKDEATASKKMWEVIRVLSHNNYFDYFTNFVQISKDELHLLGCFKMFVISYDRLLHTVTYKKVKECI
jgi:hypothetical protein